MPLHFNASPPMATVANLAGHLETNFVVTFFKSISIKGLLESDMANEKILDCIKTVLKPNCKFEGLVLNQNSGQAEIYFPALVSKLEKLGMLSEERIAEMKKCMPDKQVPTEELLCDLGEPPKMGTDDDRVPACAPLFDLLDSGLSYMLAPSLL
jgi:hypothetical protein